jgi:hypothetical protein
VEKIVLDAHPSIPAFRHLIQTKLLCSAWDRTGTTLRTSLAYSEAQRQLSVSRAIRLSQCRGRNQRRSVGALPRPLGASVESEYVFVESALSIHLASSEACFI